MANTADVLEVWQVSTDCNSPDDRQGPHQDELLVNHANLWSVNGDCRLLSSEDITDLEQCVATTISNSI